MAAYAALVSVLHLIEQIQHHPCPPVSLDKDDIQSLTEKVAFFQEFLEDYSHVRNKETDRVQSRIADAAYEVEDVIESQIVDQILARSTNHAQKINGSDVDLYQALEKVIRDMDLITKDAMEILEKIGLPQESEKNTPVTKAASASYKGLRSLELKIKRILDHPHPSFSLYKDKLQSLARKVTFVREFLGVHSVIHNEEADQWYSHIADAADAAGHEMESYVEDQILAQSTSQVEKIRGSSVDCDQALEKVILDIDLVTQDVIEILVQTVPFQDIGADTTVDGHPAVATRLALLSLDEIIEIIQRHPRPPPNKGQLQSLAKKVAFLLALQLALQLYSLVHNREIDRLHCRIIDAAHKAEDAIQSHSVDRILDQYYTIHGKQISTIVDFNQGLQKVIRDMDLIMKEVMEIKEKMGSLRDIQQRRKISTPGAASLRSSSTEKDTIVGLDDALEEIMDKLTRRQSNRQIIPIIGMGGIGKTTFAKNIYENPLIVQHFDIRAWATISQEFNEKAILFELLRNQGIHGSFSEMSEEELGEMLYKNLCGRRYLIIMDDMWDIQAWDKLKRYFPQNNCEGSIIITSRLSGLASHIPGACGLQMSFLNEDKSWNLLCKTVFGEDGCPPELEKIGKKIANQCEGLPLAIVVIGGLLAKSEQTQKYWEYTAENLSSVVNLEDNEQCLNMLYMSYNYLPIHLKSCFLYMGVYGEDEKICVSKLIKFWVAEGFLKPISGESSEEVGEEYLKALIDRNLILVDEWKPNGKPRFCKMHDLLRDLCLREAENDKFLCVAMFQRLNKLPEDINTRRHIVIHQCRSWHEIDEYYLPKIRDAFPALPRARSLVNFPLKVLPSSNFGLSRVMETSKEEDNTLDFPFQLVNLRYIAIAFLPLQLHFHRIPSSLYLLWNLQILIGGKHRVTYFDIWKMPLLRHVNWTWLHLDDPGQDGFILENLQTLSTIENFKCGEEVFMRIPNVQKLKIFYSAKASHYCPNNLGRLHKLKSLHCEFSSKLSKSDLVQNLTFPHSLKKLTLGGCRLHWRDISTKTGSLPHLQVLKLGVASVIGPEWETVEGQFLNLIFLELCDIELEHWTTEASHFPRLEQLVLKLLWSLKEVPSDIGNIPTLKLIKVDCCSRAAVVSSKEIAEEQNYLGNEDLQVGVCPAYYMPDEEIKRMASHNFRVDLSRVDLLRILPQLETL